MLLDDTIAIIPAAGRPQETWGGIRNASCDAMLPIAGKPAIFWTLQDLLSIGIRRVAIVVRQRGNDLEQFVSLLFGDQLELRFVQPDRQLGVGYSVDLGARQFADSPPLLVVLGDTIAQLGEQCDPFTRNTVLVAEVPDYARWCLATVTGDQVTALHNKPSQPVGTSLALTGVYFFAAGRATFAEIVEVESNKGRQLEMSDLLAPLVAAGTLHVNRGMPWLDVGNPDHVYEAQTRLIQSRSFNRLHVDHVRGTITKRSSYEQKFYDEINYYQLLPERLRIYFPRVVSSCNLPNRLELTMEFYAYPSLADLYLFADLSPVLWHRVLLQLREICRDFTADDYGSATEMAMDIYLEKNLSRLAQFLAAPPPAAAALATARNPKINGRPVPSLASAARRSEAALSRLAASARLTPLHGDLCFSNILCEPARGLIKLIDPRGSFGRQGVLGDFRYDVAKLTHSVLGLYDYIVNDLFHVVVDASGAVELRFPARSTEVQDRFAEVFFADYRREEILLSAAWLFLSMLPLHADSPTRQIAMAARGMELLADLGL